MCLGARKKLEFYTRKLITLYYNVQMPFNTVCSSLNAVVQKYKYSRLVACLLVLQHQVLKNMYLSIPCAETDEDLAKKNIFKMLAMV